jgi:hypothetical protein
VLQAQPDQERVVFAEPPAQGLPQRGEPAPQPALGQLGQHLGVALAGDQGGEHRPPGHAQHVGGDRVQLDPGVLEGLLDALALAGVGLDEPLAVAGQVPQFADRRRRHEARPQHLPLGDLGQPHRIQPVGLRPPRQVLDVLGVDQPGLEPVLQQIERRPPVLAGRLHHHPAHAERGQPVTQPEQRGGHRGDRPDLLHPPPTRARHPGAADHLGLAHIQRGDPLDDLGLVGVDPHRPRLPSPVVEAATRGSCRERPI